jgi:hypothetical protein
LAGEADLALPALGRQRIALIEPELLLLGDACSEDTRLSR